MYVRRPMTTMGNVQEKVDVSRIEQEVKEAPIVMYSKPGCGYCKVAKEILRDEKLDKITVVKDLTEERKKHGDKAYQTYVNGLVYKTRQTTVPQIFICEKFIGGASELNELKNEGQLWERVHECWNRLDG